MMRISIEIVPRDLNHIEAELKAVQACLTQVNTINIPDIRRLKVRSWEGCRLAKGYYGEVIPHLRAIDFNLNAPLPFIGDLESAGITSILVVSGDAPKSPQNVVYPNRGVDMIRYIKKHHPGLKVYAAIDPYRQSFQEEYRYAMDKLEAGADGFFTQPFFDLRLMQVYADLLPDTEVFWGVSPVMTQESRAYWETVNRAIFPRHFELSMAWNRGFAQDALSFAQHYQHNIYYMPIRVNIEAYLGGIL